MDFYLRLWLSLKLIIVLFYFLYFIFGVVNSPLSLVSNCTFINKMTSLFYFDLWLFIYHVTCEFAVKILLRLDKIPNSVTALSRCTQKITWLTSKIKNEEGDIYRTMTKLKELHFGPVRIFLMMTLSYYFKLENSIFLGNDIGLDTDLIRSDYEIYFISWFMNSVLFVLNHYESLEIFKNEESNLV